METALATGNLRARVLREVDGGADWFTVGGVPNPTNPLPAVEGLDRGEVEMEWREVGLGQASHWARVDRTGGGLLYRFLAAARIGFDVVQHYDLGVDPSRHTIALRPNAGSAAVSYAPVLEARLKADYEAPADEGSDLEAARAALAGKAAPLADFYAQTGNTAQSLAMARIVADNAPNTCDSWQALGQAQLAAADAAGSVASLRKAGEMYASWAARPLAERSRLQESEAKRSKKADFDGVWAQPSSCHTAWADLAVALVVAGQPEAVAEIFPARVDLDSGLPLAAGNAHLLRGDMAAAEAAYRQAVKLSYNSEDAAREGLLLAVGGRSIDLAKAQFVSNPDTSIAGFPYYQAYARVVRTAEGADAAIAALQAFLARAPWSLGGWLALAEEQAMAGRDATAALKVATELVAAQLPWDTGNARLHAENAELLRLQGKLAEAAAEAEKAQSLDPTNALGWYVRARVAEAAGDAARAAELRKRAGQIGAADPMYSSLLSGS